MSAQDIKFLSKCTNKYYMDRPWIRAKACYNWLPTNWLAALISSRGVVGTRYYKKASFTCVKEQCIILPRSLSFMRHESATPNRIALARSGKSWYRVHHSGWKSGWVGGRRFLPFWISCLIETRKRPFPFIPRHSQWEPVFYPPNRQSHGRKVTWMTKTLRLLQ